MSEVDAEKVRDIRAVRDNFVKKYLEILPLFISYEDTILKK